jgi:hypothetical protein
MDVLVAGSSDRLQSSHGGAPRCNIPSLRSERTAFDLPNCPLRNDCGYAKRAGLRTVDAMLGLATGTCNHLAAE